ncbi:MAG: UbiX family flavin prenyltransferase [Cyanobacteria bacterium REEB459]|nr:UbiX family flavin prenyltransferase [Cyanobacteria bacterium REEB459]
MTNLNYPLVLGVTGASGQIYAVRTLQYLLKAGWSVDLVASKATAMVWRAETGITLPLAPDAQVAFWRQQAGVPEAGQLRCHAWADVGASIASGSRRTAGMVIIPCSMSTVARLAVGISSDLLERAADVQIKEGRRLVIVPRETPFSLIHLRNLVALAEAGVRVVPAIPAWYHHPQTVEDLVDFVIARALDQLDIDCGALQRWQGHLPHELQPAGSDPVPTPLLED